MAKNVVGPRNYTDGNEPDPRFGKQGEAIVGMAHGAYWEASSRHKLFVASNAVAGVAPGTAQGTTPPFALWNPPNSGVDLVIVRATLGYVSGTIGAGTLAWGWNSQTTVPTTGTELTPLLTRIAAANGAGRAFTGSTITAVPAIVRPAFVLSAQAAATASPLAAAAVDFVDGEIVVPSSVVATLQGIAAAGTSPLVIISVTWEEVPV